MNSPTPIEAEQGPIGMVGMGRAEPGARVPTPLAFSILAVSYCLAAMLGLQWASFSGAAAPIWPASGIAVAGLLLGGKRLWPAIALGAVVAMQATGAEHPWWSQLASGLGSASAAVLGALLAERFGRPGFQHLATLHNLLILCAVAILAAAFSAAVGATSLLAAGAIASPLVELLVQTWFFGDFVGIVTVGALILSMTSRQVRFTRVEKLHLTAALLVCGGIAAFIFFGPQVARTWAVYPALGYVALLFRVRGASLALLVTLAVASIATILGYGPFSPEGYTPDLLLLQQFLAVTSAATLLLAAAIDERNAEVRLRKLVDAERRALELNADTERRLSLAMASAGIGMWDWDFASDRVEWSLDCYRIHGVEPGAFDGSAEAFRRFVHPDDLELLWEAARSSIDQRRDYEAEFRIIRPDGAVRWVSNTGRATYAADGTPLRMIGTIADITERKETEAELERLAERAELAQKAARSSLYELDVVTGKTIRDPFIAQLVALDPDALTNDRSAWEAQLHPDDLGEFRSTIAQALERAERYAMEYRVVRSDGSVLWIADAGRVLRDEQGGAIRVVGMVTEITDRKEAEETLRLRTAELESLIESAPIGLVYFDRAYHYLRINDMLAAMNGVPAADHLGRTVREVLPANALAIEQMVDQVFTTGEAIGNLEIAGETPLAPGVTRHWITGFFPVTSEGEVVAVGTWVIEISDRKLAEERERLLAREVDHRAKNLLAVVQSVVQLSRAEDAPGLRDSITGRIQSLARAHSLLAAGRWESVNLAELAREELAPYGLDRHDRVMIDGPAVQLRPAAAQSLALALHELATNAVKYGALGRPEGRVELLWALTEDGALAFEWRERGTGPLVKPTRSGFGSRVITASIERQLGGLVERHWGEDGLSVALRLPPGQIGDAREPPAPAPPAEAPPAPAAPSADLRTSSGTHRRILIVEDEALIGLEAEAALTARGFTVTAIAASVEEALRLATADLPDAALLDLNLGGEASFPVAEALLARGVRIVFCTGYDSNRSIPPHLAHAKVLQKPFDPAELAAALA